ncbi:MAG: SDR family NAD(P)-dependent oxidoreductase [Nostocoides sp.]
MTEPRDATSQSSTSVAVVTGGARGIGNAIARRLAAEGHAVLALDLTQPPVPPGRPDSITWRVCDITSPHEVGEALAIARSSGRPRILVNCAAVLNGFPLSELDDDRIAESLATNVAASLRLVRDLAPDLEDGGSVVNVSSIAAHRHGAPGVTVYSTTKGALDAMTRALAHELAPRGIRVNAVAPGYVDTPMSSGLTGGTPEGKQRLTRLIPLGRLGRAEEIADAVEFLASHRASYITGVVLPVDGGALTK